MKIIYAILGSLLMLAACSRQQEQVLLPPLPSPPPSPPPPIILPTPVEIPEPVKVAPRLSPEDAWQNYVNATPKLQLMWLRILELRQQEKVYGAIIDHWRANTPNWSRVDGTYLGERMARLGRDFNKQQIHEPDYRPTQVKQAEIWLPRVTKALRALEQDFNNRRNQYLTVLYYSQHVATP